jgi:hypothetical protein
MAFEKPSPDMQQQTPVIRIGRGAIALGTDGALGAVHQIIMDQRTGELQALVLATDDARHVELPAIHVLRATGSAVYVDVSRADLLQHPELVTPYHPDRYVPVRDVRDTPIGGAPSQERPMVTTIERDAVGVVVPESPARKAALLALDTAVDVEPINTMESSASSALSMPSTPSTPPDATTVAETPTPTETQTQTPTHHHGPFPPSALTPTAPLIQSADDEPPPPVDAIIEPASEPIQGHSRSISDDTTPAIAVPVITPGIHPADVAAAEVTTANPAGLENAATFNGTDGADGTNVPIEDKEEAVYMERSEPPVNPTNPVIASDTIFDDENTVADALDESQRAYTHIAPPETGQRRWDRQRLASSSSEDSGSQLSWAPAVALGALIIGIGAWSTIRAIRRGRRKAARAARNARTSVRESVREAGKSAVGLAQTMRASAQEMAANPRDTATDAFSNLSDIPARYRWFRRGMRVGSQAQRLNMKVRRPQ